MPTSDVSAIKPDASVARDKGVAVDDARYGHCVAVKVGKLRTANECRIGIVVLLTENAVEYRDSNDDPDIDGC